MNSDNSNLEEEFEQIKAQLQQLSKISLHQSKIGNVVKSYEGGEDDTNSKSDNGSKINKFET